MKFPALLLALSVLTNLVPLSIAAPKDYSGQDIKGKSFTGANLNGANFSEAVIKECDFTGASLEGANFKGADINAQFRSANAKGADFRESVVNISAMEADFSGANFEGVDMTNFGIFRVKFRGANLKNTKGWKGAANNCDFSKADLRGANLRGMDPQGETRFRGAIYDAETLWPENLDPKAAGAILSKEPSEVPRK